MKWRGVDTRRRHQPIEGGGEIEAPMLTGGRGRAKKQGGRRPVSVDLFAVIIEAMPGEANGIKGCPCERERSRNRYGLITKTSGVSPTR